MEASAALAVLVGAYVVDLRVGGVVGGDDGGWGETDGLDVENGGFEENVEETGRADDDVVECHLARGSDHCHRYNPTA